PALLRTFPYYRQYKLRKRSKISPVKRPTYPITTPELIPIIINPNTQYDGFDKEEFTAKKDLQVALKKLESSNENLEQFALMASHDLQEPARLIHSYVKLIALDETNELSEKSSEFLGFLKESSDRMRSLIHNILDYSNLRNENQEKEWFSSSEIISLSMLSCTKIIHESGAEIKNINLPEKLFCYPNQLTRVFQNLFSNSIKFTRPFKIPIIEITSIEHADHVEILVSDNGIGIPQKDRLKVFKMFTSLHSKSKYKGNGIGMNIVKKIVENHNGTVNIGNSHLGGTSISITLPLPN
ncbi:MAG: sensor histidine kinase, partial [Flavobacteriales bacterium]